jgi:hypothetical protein
MTTIAKKHTKVSVLAMARKKWGARAYLEERPNAPTAEQREANGIRRQELTAELKAMDEKIKSFGNTRKTLLDAAEFAVDVDGDEPSWTQLVNAVRHAKDFDNAVDKRKELFDEQRKIPHGYTHRFGIYTVDNIGGIAMAHEHARADTLEELAQAIYKRD